MGHGKKDAARTHFVCQNCGAASPKWMGRCPDCGAWNSLVEERIEKPAAGPRSQTKLTSRPRTLDQIPTTAASRLATGLGEFDRVLGGGFVAGEVVLLGGQPGIGKSTLLLQCCSHLEKSGHDILYVSGEESEEQIKLRADRLNITGAKIHLMSEQSLELIVSTIEAMNPDFVVVDSIQTVSREEFDSAPGSVTQVRECAHALTEIAKRTGTPVVMVGHVTKEGYLAGPKVVEHVVDALLLFEGDAQHPYRILRAMKNRFGSTDEIGVFEMTGLGLQEVHNPSELFLSERAEAVPGSVVTCVLQGSRPVLIEVQALTTVSHYSVPQRTCTGFDPRRLAMLLAVLERRAAINAGAHDVFVNIAGGMRIDEPAADLAVAVAVASSVKNRAIPRDVVVFGEVGLGGEVRRVQHTTWRVQEAFRLGFSRVVAPRAERRGLPPHGQNQTVEPVATLGEALRVLLS
ncbi:MAG: DNA repair protein RadA [candidate division KSB1 bacterium]|nr:DNA repair protein RadA [candidate division KSB1 bacterium]